jgi:hypothetical protein
MADLRGFMYGITSTTNPDGTPTATQELFRASSDGIIQTISTISTNQACTVSPGGAQAAFTNRTVSVVGYNLAALALYLEVIDNSGAWAMSGPQNGYTLICTPSGSLGLYNPAIPPPPAPTVQETSQSTNTILKITGRAAL